MYYACVYGVGMVLMRFNLDLLRLQMVYYGLTKDILKHYEWFMHDVLQMYTGCCIELLMI